MIKQMEIGKMDYAKILKELQSGKMPKTHYCETCGVITETYFDNVKEIFEICGEKIEVEGKGLFCAKCKQRINDVETDDNLLIAAYDKFREKHDYLMPHEIEKIRTQYKLSAKQFAQILGMGTHAIYNYERGALQSIQHDNLIKHAAIPSNMRMFLLNSKAVSQSRVEKTLELINGMCLVQQLYYNNGYSLPVNKSFSISIV